MRIFRRLIVSFLLVLSLAGLSYAQAAREGAPTELVTFCASAGETDTDMNITIFDDGSISGEFFMSECGSGPLFGYAQINIDSTESADGGWWGKLFIYTDILGGCSIPGAFYSVDVPDLIYRWHAGQAVETDASLVNASADTSSMSGAGILELLECGQ